MALLLLSMQTPCKGVCREEEERTDDELSTFTNMAVAVKDVT
jgi:hypothetical protein